MAQDWARPVVHWEIEATDPERQKAFYADLFNWRIGDGFIMHRVVVQSIGHHGSEWEPVLFK